ncbi:hypothetical protein EW145_g2633 [Phellinidium pouzarii]|uniref:BTB domain-containing protein n=1 Tax=Phellinidium pouzarii TaxID=167371 RepID=A0A4S4LAL9_9AGAM|nr:hypothetical protein EW145_g2633 [Phellinidium pouzarii]
MEPSSSSSSSSSGVLFIHQVPQGRQEPLESDCISPDVALPEWQPTYISPDADVVLLSSDGQKFRVHSSIMVLASGFFKGMLGLPQSRSQHNVEQTSPNAAEDETIALQERSGVLKAILDIVYPDRTFFDSGDPTFDLFREICFAAEKYDMPSVLQSLQLFLRATIRDHPPILAYALACRYSWTKEAELASTETLSHNIRTQDSMDQLKHASMEGAMQLIRFHFTRCDLLIAALDFTDTRHTRAPLVIEWPAIQSSRCKCVKPRSHLDMSLWTVLKYHILEKMEKSPDGAFLRNREFWDHSEFNRLWDFVCDCSRTPMLDKNNLREEILRVLENLPKTI